MATGEKARCKECGAQLWSAVERDQATCTACLGRARLAGRKGGQAKGKTGGTQTPTRYTTDPPVGETPVYPDPQATSGLKRKTPPKRKASETQTPTGYTSTVTVKIDEGLQAKLLVYLDQTGESASGYIRRLLKQALE